MRRLFDKTIMFLLALLVCVGLTAVGACSGEQKACQLKRNPNIQFATRHQSGRTDNAYAYNNIRDMCDGNEASLSNYSCSECSSGAPGGTTCLDPDVLDYLLDLAASYSNVFVTELAGGCHSCSSLHYTGRAVDLRVHNIGQAQRQDYVDICDNLGATQALDERTHIHCAF